MKVNRLNLAWVAAAAMAAIPVAQCSATTILGDFYASYSNIGKTTAPVPDQTAASVTAFTSAGVPNLTAADTVTGFDLSDGGTVAENGGIGFPITSGGITVTSNHNYFAHGMGPAGSVYQAGPFNGTAATTISGLNALVPAGEPENIYLFTTDIFTTAPNTVTLIYAGTTYGPTTVSTTPGFAEFSVTSGTDSFSVVDVPSGGATYADFTAFAIQATPEPSSLCLLGLGAFGLMARRRRRKPSFILDAESRMPPLDPLDSHRIRGSGDLPETRQ